LRKKEGRRELRRGASWEGGKATASKVDIIFQVPKKRKKRKKNWGFGRRPPWVKKTDLLIFEQKKGAQIHNGKEA